MECEEADVLEMIYNISYFSEEKNDKADDVWFIHVSSDEGEENLQVNCWFSLPEVAMYIFVLGSEAGLFWEMLLINHHTFASWLGEGNYASIATISSLLLYGSPAPGDKCVNYYVSDPELFWLLPFPSGFGL